MLKLRKGPRVAPLAGAWIEMYSYKVKQKQITVAPLAGAWIEILFLRLSNQPLLSLPLRERGLKWQKSLRYLSRHVSLPLRERGLKWNHQEPESEDGFVAPLAGAWIEICEPIKIVTKDKGRSPCGSVD